MGKLLENSHGADVSLKIPLMLPFSSLTPRTQCFNSYENHFLIVCRNGQLWWASNKEGKASSQKNTDHESVLYSASNYYPILSEEAKAIAETDCQQGIDNILGEQTFYVKTLALQRFHLISTVGDQIHNFPCLKNVCIHDFYFCLDRTDLLFILSDCLTL